MKSVYDDSQASVKTYLGNSLFVNVKKGVKQGDMLSAILFCVALAAVILRTEDATNTGLSIGGHIISNLSYADDIALTINSPANLKHFVNELTDNAKEIVFELYLSKTEYMITNKHQIPLNLTIYYKPIKQVSEFIYLGHKLTSNNNHEAALKHRIGLGWAAFQKKSMVLKSKRAPISVKVKPYLIYILPAVLYGPYCLTWNKALANQIEVFQNHIMRFFTGQNFWKNQNFCLTQKNSITLSF